MSKDYYKVLGVEKSATKADIKKAYKKLAMKFHPDRASEDKKSEHEEKFKEINEAAAVLGDEKKRAQYDQYGDAAFQGGSGFEGYDFSDVMSQFRSGMFGNFDDIFDQLFGGGGRSSRRGRRGSDLLYELEITLPEAAAGVKKEIQLNKLENCDECSGKGAHKFENCHHCSGSGFMKRTQRTAFGLFQQTGPCPYCHGKGELPQDSCDKCHGEGLERRKKKLEISIPAGVKSGMRLRVGGEGEVGGGGGTAGDLYVQVHVSEHDYYSREGDDLHITVPVSFTQAVLGDEIEVPLINGKKADLVIPAGTQSETIFRMRGKGIPGIRGGNGDQMVKIKITVPKKLTKKQKDLIKQLGEEKASKSFLEKIFG